MPFKLEILMIRTIALCAIAALVAGCGTTSTFAQHKETTPPRTSTDAQAVKPASVPQGAAKKAVFCPKEAINIPMRKQISSFRACYEKEFAKNPTLEGRVDSHFSVNKDGKAIDVSTTGLPRVGACIADVIRNIQFEWRHGCHNIKWPFVFKAK